jgi:phosphoribosylamine--glycine ligase
LPKLKNDLLDIFVACCDEKLDQIKIKWSNKKSLCVVLCSKGYPDKYKKNIEIKNFKQIKNR